MRVSFHKKSFNKIVLDVFEVDKSLEMDPDLES